MQQVQVLRDVSNISYVTFTGKNKEAFEKATKLSTDNYPELLLRAHIVNAPWVFGAIWNIAKLFLPQRTIEKVFKMRVQVLLPVYIDNLVHISLLKGFYERY